MREPTCEICGCTENDACQVHGVPCVWVRGYEPQETLCSACAPVELLTADPSGRIWLKQVMARAREKQATPYDPCNSTRLEAKSACRRFISPDEED